jgi:hypothetical protein
MEERRSIKCQAINTLASTAENSYLQTIMCALSVEKLTPLDLSDARNAEAQLKRDKSNAATVACHFR